MKKFISIFNISIIENTLEFELSTLDKWYAINRKRNICLEIKDKDLRKLLSDCLQLKAEKDQVIELIIVTMLNKIEGLL
jgi:hypothetical protein